MSIPLPEPTATFVLSPEMGAEIEFHSPHRLKPGDKFLLFGGYTTIQAYAAACRKDERECIAAWLDAEHEKRKHIDNLAAYYAQAIRSML